jgi:hypothetical protein
MNISTDVTQSKPLGWPQFKGKCYFRESEGNSQKEYRLHAYQYATTSEPVGSMMPYAIIYVEDDEDIMMAIRYCNEHKLSLAVRSGGHQYRGYSSTNGANLQIDLSGLESPNRQNYPYRKWFYDETTNRATIGAGLTVAEIDEESAKCGVFFPHGECAHVCAGGHSQTGGYGLIARPLGLLVDYIYSYDIIMADCTKRTVKRDSEDPDDKDLFFSLAGGSPGNLGVITSVTVNCLKDADFANARGFKLAYPYSKERLQKLLEICAEQSDNPIDDDFCYSVMVLGGKHFYSIFGGLDQEMRLHHEKFYGKRHEFHPVAAIGVFGFWANLEGKNQTYDPSIFKRIKEVAGMPLPFIGFDTTELNDKPIPCSKMMMEWAWKDPREFDLPFHKRLWMTKSTSLVQDGFAKWATEQIDNIQAPLLNGCKIAAQFMPLSGKSTKFQTGNKDHKTSAAWRDSTSFSALDVFYEPNMRKAPQLAAEWCEKIQQEGIGAKGVFSKEDRRFIWSPFGEHNLDLVYQCYYDNEEDYQRILRVKQKVDPNFIFTPNLFGVGASLKYKKS